MTQIDIAYDSLRFWLPLVSGFAIVVKAYMSAKKSVGEWASRLLNNHLSHIQAATQETAASIGVLGKMLLDHQDKEMQVWSGVVQNLAVLSDRTAVRRKRARK
jgi:hypothetical protein